MTNDHADQEMTTMDSGIALRDTPSFSDIQRLQAIISTYP